MKVLSSELVMLHELVFDSYEVLKLRACGILPPWCLVPARLKQTIEDMRRTAQLLAEGDQLAEDLRATVLQLAPSTPPAVGELRLHILVTGAALCGGRHWGPGHTCCDLEHADELAAACTIAIWTGETWIKPCVLCFARAKERHAH